MPGRVSGWESAEPLSRSHRAGFELHLLSGYLERHAPARGNSPVSIARISGKEASYLFVDGRAAEILLGPLCVVILSRADGEGSPDGVRFSTRTNRRTFFQIRCQISVVGSQRSLNNVQHLSSAT